MDKHARLVVKGEEKRNHLMVYTTSVLMVVASAIAATFAPGGWPWFTHLFYVLSQTYG